MLHHQGREHFLRVFLEQSLSGFRHHQHGGRHDKHGNEGKQQIQHTADDGALARCGRAVGRHYALKHVLLGNRAQHHGDGSSDEERPLFDSAAGEKLELALACGVFHHLARAACQVGSKPGNRQQAHANHDHLHEIGHGHRPHAAVQGVNQHHQRANDHAHGDRYSPLGEQIEHQAQGRDLGSHPAQVAEHDDGRTGHLNHPPIALAVVIAQRDQVLLVELVGKEKADQHQAHRRPEGVLDHGSEISINEAGRDPKHRL